MLYTRPAPVWATIAERVCVLFFSYSTAIFIEIGLEFALSLFQNRINSVVYDLVAARCACTSVFTWHMH